MSNKVKLILVFILGVIVSVSISVYASSIINSKDVLYDNTTTNLSANVQGAIDELYTNSKLKNRDNIVEAYTYNQVSKSNNYCITGNEDTCVLTNCYKNKTAGSCKSGDIIRYKVNDSDIVTFHVIIDNGSTITMQSQKNIINNVQWIDATDYAQSNTNLTSCTNPSCNDEGPITIVKVLDKATYKWTNVNNQTYEIGKTTFKSNPYTGCSSYNSCTSNVYTLPSRTTKARMITVQEASYLGCTQTEKSCPIWMYNYLNDSTSYGGTIDDKTIDIYFQNTNNGYWTLSANLNADIAAFGIRYTGMIRDFDNIYATGYGVRPVVVISK